MLINQNMKKLLDDPRLTEELKRTRLVPGLREIIEAPLIETATGGFLLKPFYGPGLDNEDTLRFFQDLTGLEASETHVHMGSYLSRERGENGWVVLAQGIEYARQLEARLRRHGEFLVILGYNEDEEFGPDCNVRYHRARPEEGGWLTWDLEGYRMDALMLWGAYEMLGYEGIEVAI